MKKILIRGGMSPFENMTIQEIISYNRIGFNVGNLVYLYSIYRALMVDDVEIVPTHYMVKNLDVDRINEECSAFVIPLADAIRNSYVGDFKRLTKFINKLKIPCHVIGVGIRAPYNYIDNGITFDYDDVAYDFFRAILNRSPMIGVRGEITAEYLKKIGFVPEKDFTVIGCPSFYCNGDELKLKPLKIDKNIKIAFNNNVMSGDNVQKFLRNICTTYQNHYYFPQRIDELKTLYLGDNYRFKRKCEGYPSTAFDELYIKDRVKFYVHVYDWLKELSQMDLSIGPRLHGNVAAALAGIPAVWILHDARMKEIVEYHHLPHIKQSDLNENDTLYDVLQGVDFEDISRGHRKRFEHYVDFLNKIGLNNIFDDYKNPKFSVFDRKINEMHENMDNEILSIWKCDTAEIIRRRNFETDMELGKKNLSDYENELSEIAYLKQELNMKANKLDETSQKLNVVKDELREIKKSFWYRVLRKLRKFMDRLVIKNPEE